MNARYLHCGKTTLASMPAIEYWANLFHQLVGPVFVFCDTSSMDPLWREALWRHDPAESPIHEMKSFRIAVARYDTMVAHAKMLWREVRAMTQTRHFRRL